MAGNDINPFLLDEAQRGRQTGFGPQAVFPPKTPKDKYAEYGTCPKLTTAPRRQLIALLSFTLGLPWALFLVVFAVWSLQHHAGRAWAITAVCFVLVLAYAVLPYLPAWTVEGLGFKCAAPGLYWENPAWQNVLAFAMAFALLLAVFWGNLLFSQSFEEYDLINSLQANKKLQAYENVDPTGTSRGWLMNAGFVGFVEGAAPRRDLALGFHNQRTYCVAPIARNDSSGVDYGFWAAGVDCCTGSPGSFNCGAPNGRMGERILKGTDLDYYTLAVQKAESTFSISAPEPLFFRWVQDTATDLEKRRQANVKPFLIGLFVHLAVQAALVLGAWLFLRPKASSVRDLLGLTYSPSGV